MARALVESSAVAIVASAVIRLERMAKSLSDWPSGMAGMIPPCGSHGVENYGDVRQMAKLRQASASAGSTILQPRDAGF
jgi:hypothetical protein